MSTTTVPDITMDRLPKGIESCRFITLTSQEGYA